ncbi:Coagulation factor XI [Smittium culicis]|uniref:Coagulation factor XI n=1 Tax=Smittium culicis TaxID=133412 RepID=A0A1R1Y564_9FUNG|nr:Coagulation factor XI [Smittium culicis]
MVPTVAGWGETGGPFDSLLKKANMFVVSNSNCSLYEKEYTDNNGFAICLESDGISSPCSGDSGGPLALSYLPDAPVIGITSKFASHNPTLNMDCNYLETTWYFTNVFAHIDFISENTGVPKELLLYSTEGTTQEKDIEIQKITGSKREIVTPHEEISSSSSSESSSSESSTSESSSSESSTSESLSSESSTSESSSTESSTSEPSSESNTETVTKSTTASSIKTCKSYADYPNFNVISYPSNKMYDLNNPIVLPCEGRDFILQFGIFSDYDTYIAFTDDKGKIYILFWKKISSPF